MHSERRPLTIGLVLIVTGIAFESLAVATVMPEVARDLDGIRLYGWAFSAFMLAHLAGVAVAGPIGDHRGPAKPFAVGLALFGVGLLGGGLAPSMPVLVVARAVQGIGAGAAFSMAYVAIGTVYPPAERARLFAILSTAWVVPGVTGPAIAGAVAELVGWRAVFLGLMPMLPLAGALALPPMRRVTPHPEAEGGQPPVADAVRLAAGTGAVLAGLAAASPAASVALVLVGAVAAVPAFTRLVPPGTIRAAAPLPAAVAVRGMLGFAFFGTEAFVPLALTALRGWSPTEAGLSLTMSALTWTMASWTNARMGPRWGPRRTALAGVLCVGGGIGLMALVLVPAVPGALAYLAWAVAGFGMGLGYPSVTLVSLEHAPPGQVGRAGSAVQLSETLGIGIGTGLGGAALAIAVGSGWGARTGIAVTDGLMLVAVVVGCLACRRLPGRTTAPTPGPAPSPDPTSPSPAPAPPEPTGSR